MKNTQWYNILTLIIAIAALAFGFYQHWDSKIEIDPTFIGESTKQQILSKALVEKAPIRILKASGEEIKGNVYSQTFYFFNQGKKPIKRENIIESLKLTFTDTAAKILDARITKISRGVTASKLRVDSLGACLWLDFSILEENDGFAGQVIYMSQLNPDLVLSGAIEGAPQGFSTSYKGEYGSLSIIVKWLTPTIALLVLILFVSLLIFLSPKKTKNATSNDPELAINQSENLTSWLTQEYQLIIRNEANYSEKTSISFTYAKVILVNVVIFLIFLIVSLFLVDTVLEKWFDPQYDKSKMELPLPKTLL